MTATLEMRGVTKRFPGVVANDHIGLRVVPGEVHALLGENGAGKSTLMNILYGLYEPDEGEILLDGTPVRFAGPRDAIAHRIGMVHQHFMLVPPLTVAENVMLGDECTHGPLLDQEEAHRRVRDLSDRYGLTVDPAARIVDLSVGMQQRVEIVKALYRGADILILDEPTAVLTPQEADDLLTVMRDLARQGKSIVFITHKLREVLDVADQITVLRAGRVVATTTPAALQAGIDPQAAPGGAPPGTRSAAEILAAMMVGRPVLLQVEKVPAQPGGVVLHVEALTVLSDRRTVAVHNLTLDVRAGEILGLAGVEGNGQTELVEALTGLRPLEHGRILLEDRDLTHASPRNFVEAGLAHIPADRQKYGLVLTQPVAENLVLSTYYQPPYARGIRRIFEAIWQHARHLVRAFDIRTPSPAVLAGALSGGNQQKTVAAREFTRPIRLLVAAQPARGLDVGSMEFIHRKIVEARDAGVAVLLVSAELDEVMSLADRIAVIYRGGIVGEVPAASADAEALGLLMAGGHGATAP
ncbi:MAG: ABC transporter ATP-binding protein [Dehalococcoidia bacterium]